MPEFGKRTLNKAQTRLNVLDTVYRLSHEQAFKDMKAKAIAEEVGITEMTFFNYFPKKEDILKYMMGIWAFDLLVLQKKEPLQGEAAIRRVFSHTADQIKQHPRLMANFVASLLTSELDPNAHTIEPADRYLLHPDASELLEETIPSGNEILMRHLFEIDPTKDHTNTLMHLASSFYGDVIVAHTAGLDIGLVYENSLDLIFSKL